ncbi:MAG: formate dehydrogenase accessory sulfurtransferase FdhD [Thermodesulfobacteriota bacterium]|nr:formate dehydrogenase accessory sulfurtransferase FdhD [Thermodesulfobacteriota bacterium]
MDSTLRNNIICYEEGSRRPSEQELVGEEPLLIRIEDQPYSVVMRTPGEEVFHAAGFCLAEGLVDEPKDFAAIGHCVDLDPNVIDVRLVPERRDEVSDLLERRAFISQTSCGICGKELMKDLFQILTPNRDETSINIDQAIECVDRLGQHQDLFKRTHASHAVMLFDSELEPLSMAEDVGRHNALDKAIGKVFMRSQLAKARLAVLSSRISYELVQKAARAHLPILIGMSNPTALAVELGSNLNMTLACAGKRKPGLTVFCGEERLS